MKIRKKKFRGSIIVLIYQTEKCNERCRLNECRNFIFAEVIDQNNLWTIIYLLKFAFYICILLLDDCFFHGEFCLAVRILTSVSK